MNCRYLAVVYLGFAIPSRIEKIIAAVDEHSHIATQKFSMSIVSALISSFYKVYLISTPEVRNYPAAKKIIFRSENFKINNINGVLIGFINIIFLKHFTRLMQLLRFFPSVLRKHRASLIIVHGTHTPFMIGALLIRKIYSVKCFLLLSDQHGKDIPSDGLLGRILRKFDTYLMNFLIKSFDGYICLSPLFVRKFNLINYVIIPGIVNNKFVSIVNSIKKLNAQPNIFKVTFAGRLSNENGVDLILDALQYILDDDILISFYGSGELSNRIEEISKIDNRVFYGGLIDGYPFVKALLLSDLLINPRPTGKEYAQTSFPSKLIEYMSTGVPTLSTRLISIPENIKDCLFYIDREDPRGISEAILFLKNLPSVSLKKSGELAKERVTELYSEQAFGQNVCRLFLGLQ